EQRETEKEIRESEQEKEKLIIELRESFSEIKTLSGLLPICASCKKIRDDNGYWNQIEAYISKHSDAQFTHAVCPDCVNKLYSDLDLGR
ncbi:MAG: response regulator, partial [Dissulfurispiraceae bacterium]